MIPDSSAQQSFLRKYKKRQQFICLMRLAVFLVFLLLWEVSARLGFIDSFIFGSPSQVCLAFRTLLLTNHLLSHIGITVFETLASFFLVVVFSLFFSVLLWICPRLAAIMEPYLVVLNSLPKSALAPLLIVWLGASYKTIILAGISVAIFGSIPNLYTSFTEIDPDSLKLIRTLGGKRKDELLRVALPSSIPYLLSVMKVNIGLCLVGVVIGEFIGARQGLGFLIIYSSQIFKLDWMILSIILLCIIAMILYQAVSLVEKRVVHVAGANHS